MEFITNFVMRIIFGYGSNIEDPASEAHKNLVKAVIAFVSVILCILSLPEMCSND
jgi:hypothetical protein